MPLGRHRRRRLRRRPEGPRRRPPVPRARRAPLRRDVLAAPGVGGRPAPRGGLRRPARPAPRARGRPPGAAVVRGPDDGAARGQRPAGRRSPSRSSSPGCCRRCPRAPTCWCWPPSWPASAAPTCPLEVSAIDSFASVTDAAERSLTIVARIEVGLDKIFLGQEQLCDVLDRCHDGQHVPARPGPGLARRVLIRADHRRGAIAANLRRTRRRSKKTGTFRADIRAIAMIGVQESPTATPPKH